MSEHDKENALDRAQPQRVRVNEEDDEELDDEQTVFTKEEIERIVSEKMQLFWEDKKREQLYWQEQRPQNSVPNKNQLNFWEQIDSELKQGLTRQKGNETSLDHQRQLEHMRLHPEQYSQTQKDELVSKVFGELSQAFVRADMMSETEGQVAAARNSRAAKKSFFRE